MTSVTVLVFKNLYNHQKKWNSMDTPIRHNTDWRFSTLTSWLAATGACAYYADSFLNLTILLGINVCILPLLLYVIKHPNKHVLPMAGCYFLLILCLLPFTSTSLVFIHLVMFTAVFSPHFALSRFVMAILGAMLVYGACHYDTWQGDIPWLMFIVWFFFCVTNWFISRKIVESLNMHYQSRQNYKELQATQQMMSAMSAKQERRAISRELHDSLGHKLTALSVNLDFAKRTAPTDLQTMLINCHQISQDVLEEVRDIVSTQREDKALLKEVIESICALTPNLKAHINIDKDSAYMSQDSTLCVIRFCQEMLSNTLKHTHATEITFNVTLEEQHTMLSAEAFHNQPETVLPKPGNGLTGLAERVAQFNGHFTQAIENQVLINTINLPLCQSNHSHANAEVIQ
ncbi:histidine kinase [Pseudoalteromonas ulvae]|uniref:histidine kinase n=2 Tax=Pseudoalteromonas ulvae TaxID=107327 RepID=A0A244CUK9_PSEDV|nr:histidine kinase [Pseudoalteromonas ulvae]